MYYQLVAAELALKIQLLDVFDDVDFRGLCDRYTGFTGVSYMQMITHLYKDYSITTEIEIIENTQRMDAPYDPYITIKSYFD